MSASEAPCQTRQESPAKETRGYLSALAGGKSPISMPPIPAWMLNTPMYSKLPMIPAPKGKITLYTTGLGEKLYPTPVGLDFDPSAEGLSSEYKSLHDPHLKSHYTQPSTFHGLIRKKFITPEGKVICTLKEFNDYHQYLKRVNIEKLGQDRKSVATKEREERQRQRQEWSNKEELSPHDKQVLETRMRKRKMLKEHHRRLCHHLEQDTVRHHRVLEEKQMKRSIDRARRNLEREKKRNKILRAELEEHIRRATKRVNLVEDETRHAELLKCYRMSVSQKREMKLEEQWNRHQKIREKHRLEAVRRRKELHAQTENNIDTREQATSDKWSKQLSGRRRRPPRHGLGGPRHYSTWPVEHVLGRVDLSPADGVWKIVDDRYLTTAQPTEFPAPVSPTTFLEPTVTIETKERVPEIETVSRGILQKIKEEESVADIQEDRMYSSIELAALFGDHYTSFITSARDLVKNVFNALESEKRSMEHVSKELDFIESGMAVSKETKLPDVMRRKSVLQLTNSTVARLVLSNMFKRAREQIAAEGGLPHLPSVTPTREAVSDTLAAAVTKRPSIGKQTSVRELHPPSPIAKSGVMPDGSIRPKEKPSPKGTSSSLLAAALVSEALGKVTRELEEEAQRSETRVLAEDVVWDTIRNVTSQLQKELSEKVSLELEEESKRSDTSILAEDVVQTAITNVTSELQKELMESGITLIAERVVSDAISNAAKQLREWRLMHSSSSVLGEELASTAIRDATRHLQMLLPQSSSSIIAEAIAADAMKNVIRQLGAQPPQTSSSILAQAFTAGALKNAARRLQGEQIGYAFHPPAHTSSSLLAQAITNDTLQKVMRQLQQECEALQPHTSSSLLAQAVTNDALANAVQQLERRVPSPHSDTSLLAQIVTREALQNAAVQLRVEKLLQNPQTFSSTVAHEITIDALQNAVAQLTSERAQLHRTSSSKLAQLTVDEALKTAKEQLWTERASSRCQSRSPHSASPFSPELAKSAVNQTSPELTQRGAKTRAVASDIIKRTALDVESPSPTKDVKPLSPSRAQDAAASSVLPTSVDDGLEKVSHGLSCQAQTVVMHVFGEALASYQLIDDEATKMSEENDGEEKPIGARRSSLLLEAVNEVFRESEIDLSHHQHHPHSGACESEGSDSEEEPEEDDKIIGVIENEVIAKEESVHSLAECLEGSRVEGLTSVVKKSHDRTVFEGAVIPHDKAHESVTEKVLSVEELHKNGSGHLVHDASSKSIHKVAESGEYSQEQIHAARHHYSNIVPVYHSHPLNLDEEIISHNLSAISMKPDSQQKVPSAYSTSSRNSFRNVFRPDLTHCQGSAKCLKDTLIRELSHPHHREHDQMYSVLEQPHEDITAHYSDEELVGQEEAEGVCYLPQRKVYRVHEVVEDVLPEEEGEYVEADSSALPQASPDARDTPAGGDFRSPNEEEIEHTAPLSRASTRSIRSGKSKEIKSLHSKTGSQEASVHLSPNKIQSKLGGKSKSTTEAGVSSHVPASRSVIGAVIDRISSIFGRKHSTKVHPGLTDSHAADATGRQPPSRDQSSTKPDTWSKAVLKTHPGDKSDVKYEPCDGKETGVRSTSAPEDDALKPLGVDPHQIQDMESRKEEDSVVQPCTEEITERSEDDTVQRPGEIDSEPPREKSEPKSSNKEKEQETTEDQTTVDITEIVQKEAVKDGEEEAVNADDEITKCTELHELHVEAQGPSPFTGAETMQFQGGKDREDTEDKEPSSVQKRPSFADENKVDSKKSFQTASESSLKEMHAGKSRTLKPYVNSLGTVSRPAKSSSAALGRQFQQRSPTSASPKPGVCTSSPLTSKVHPSATKLSVHSFKRPILGNEKPLSPAKPSCGSSVSNVDRRSQVTKPPSTGSVRLIKVSPAPSMSRARRRSGKLSSSSVGKLMSDRASGRSVRLIKVSPAASTAIGPRRSSRNSPSEAIVKGSALSRPSSTSNRVQQLSRDKSVSRQASSESVQSQWKGAVLSVRSPQGSVGDEVRQSPASRAESRPPSTRSFVTISTKPETTSALHGTVVSCPPPTISGPLSDQQQLIEQEQRIQPDLAQQTQGVRAVSKGGRQEEHSGELPRDSRDLGMQIEQSNTDQTQNLEGTVASGEACDEMRTPVNSPMGGQFGEHSSNSSGSHGAKASHRSKSIISAVIERLSRMFSGEAGGSKTNTTERHRSDVQIGAASSGAVSGMEERKVQQSQSSGAVLHQLSTCRDVQTYKLKPQLRERKASNTGGKEMDGTKSRKPETYDREAPLAIAPKSSVSDPTAPAAEQAAQVIITHSAEPSEPGPLSTQDPGNSSLPPVEAVETPTQTSSFRELTVSPKEISDNSERTEGKTPPVVGRRLTGGDDLSLDDCKGLAIFRAQISGLTSPLLRSLFQNLLKHN
ncbi:uncharacterized protein LOC110980670 isoform X2 [Acanthaster planci]|uniref:Uncharacterized protein LOC110980670 isoform X2 n=1 Tax=Acanthaster planci TaxID=133434 RepID=A0A8B7YKV0_ACAPL|nr:uncharacterized protein LOC110980670 isoform X2 [Acanthaster planci]